MRVPRNEGLAARDGGGVELEERGDVVSVRHHHQLEHRRLRVAAQLGAHRVRRDRVGIDLQRQRKSGCSSLVQSSLVYGIERSIR